MEQFFANLAAINDAINTFVWVKIGLALLLGTGLLTSIATGFFQLTHCRHWCQQTFLQLFSKHSHDKSDRNAVSQFQALCTALAATVGTGNIAGVAAAIALGGPGAVFWMWVAAFLGMMTNYSENVLGIYYRRRNREKEWSGGPMYYLSEGLGGYRGCKWLGKVLAVFFALSAILASFGIGNMGQVNKIVQNVEAAFFANVHAPVLWGSGDSQVTLVAVIIGLVLVAIGVMLIVRACTVWGGFHRLLETGDYSRERKLENKKNQHIDAIYWASAIVIYLAWSFTTMNWHQTWIVWPIAGVGYGVLIAVLRAIRSKE